MAKRSELINQESMDGLLLHHPYILLFQKNDWREYLELIALIYDYLEEAYAPVPFDVLKTILYHHYSDKVASTDAKITNFFTMMIAELQVLKDSHDQWGKRFIESTPHGKELLKFVESMLVQRTRFSGTSAEMMLGALNGLLFSTQNMSQGDAEKHHREKIKAYQADLEKIIKNGPKAAELLPLTHSYEALFGQAEEAAIHVLAATEDVKVAIERERKKLAERYIKQEKSAGENIRILADFHLELHQTEEYKSYKQAKDLFSQLSAQVRFKYNDVNRLLGVLLEKDVVSDDTLKKSHLSRFSNQFEAADASIREKIKVQIEILRQQVNHALMTDTHLVQNSLNNIFKLLYGQKDLAHRCLEDMGLEVRHPWSPDFGVIELNSFHIPTEIEGMKIAEEEWTVEDLMSIGLGLARAEENTILNILTKLKERLIEQKLILVSSYGELTSLAELYVLLEADILEPAISKELKGSCDLSFSFLGRAFVLCEVPDYQYTIKESYESTS
ncbi:MAG: hypothetical protein ACOVP4_02195 [Bacteriovoracaceae bacterium]